jgi:hypothetical protein
MKQQHCRKHFNMVTNLSNGRDVMGKTQREWWAVGGGGREDDIVSSFGYEVTAYLDTNNPTF